MLTSVMQRLNEKCTAKLEGEADSGFTLIELMVVLLIGVCSADIGAGITALGLHNSAWTANAFPSDAT